MLYQLFDWLKNEGIKIPGGNLFLFITFRVLLAILLSLVVSTLVGKKIINFLRKKQIGESVRDLGLAGEKQKKVVWVYACYKQVTPSGKMERS